MLSEPENCSLEKIISSNDVLRECDRKNQKLINFLINEKQLKIFLKYLLIEPSKNDSFDV